MTILSSYVSNKKRLQKKSDDGSMLTWPRNLITIFSKRLCVCACVSHSIERSESHGYSLPLSPFRQIIMPKGKHRFQTTHHPSSDKWMDMLQQWMDSRLT